MSKMTDKEIKQALELCSHCECNNEKTETECSLINMPFCKNYLRKQSLDLINRQQAKIEELNIRLRKERHQFADLGKMYSEIRAEAIKEFVNSATDLCYKEFGSELEVAHTFAAILTRTLDSFEKEMVGEGK